MAQALLNQSRSPGNAKPVRWFRAEMIRSSRSSWWRSKRSLRMLSSSDGAISVPVLVQGLQAWQVKVPVSVPPQIPENQNRDARPACPNEHQGQVNSEDGATSPENHHQPVCQPARELGPHHDQPQERIARQVKNDPQDALDNHAALDLVSGAVESLAWVIFMNSSSCTIPWRSPRTRCIR